MNVKYIVNTLTLVEQRTPTVTNKTGWPTRCSTYSLSRPQASCQCRTRKTTAFMRHWSDCLYQFHPVRTFQSIEQQRSSQTFCAVCSFHFVCVSIPDLFFYPHWCIWLTLRSFIILHWTWRQSRLFSYFNLHYIAIGYCLQKQFVIAI